MPKVVSGLRLRARKGTFKKRAEAFLTERGFETARMFETLQGYLNVLENGRDDFARIVEEEANALFADVVADTPVDTGAAKAGWRLDNKSVPGRIEIQIWNDVPYVVYLEYGWSQQAPQGMLRLNLRRRRKILQDRIRRRLNKLASE